MKKLIAVGHNNVIKYVYGNETVVIKKIKGKYFLFAKDHYSRILDDLSEEVISKAMKNIEKSKERLDEIKELKGKYFLLVNDHYGKILDELSEEAISKAMKNIEV